MGAPRRSRLLLGLTLAAVVALPAASCSRGPSSDGPRVAALRTTTSTSSTTTTTEPVTVPAPTAPPPAGTAAAVGPLSSPPLPPAGPGFVAGKV
jgi:hypothetical protein